MVLLLCSSRWSSEQAGRERVSSLSEVTPQQDNLKCTGTCSYFEGRKKIIFIQAWMLCYYLFLRWSQSVSGKLEPFVCGAYTLVNYVEVACLEQGRLYPFYTIFIRKACVLKWREHLSEKSDWFSNHFLNECVCHEPMMLLRASHLLVLSWKFSSVRQTFLTEFSVALPTPLTFCGFCHKVIISNWNKS